MIERLILIGAMGALVACRGDSSDDTSASAAQESSSSESTFQPTTNGNAGTDTFLDESESTGEDRPDASECSLWEQDCPDGEKCVPWSATADLVPDDIRCCPERTNAKLPGESCSVEGYFGSCLDDCAEGSLCLDVDDDGEGVCSALCGGAPDQPRCEQNQHCFIYFADVPICFDQCDPLQQGCAPGYGCYPDEAAAGSTGFLCLPTVGAETMGDYCWLLSNCEPGLFCVTPEYLPGCNGLVGCCTQICDVTEPDVCPDLHPDLRCTSWYYAGDAPPQAGLENVGICVLPLP